ncbi:MAG: endonuclease/exonuclease/phosphatase family protein [Polyangiaceae bacterium]|nr:endonuclease/exonuclease/phosphatase family protein [Polyangiaceae bacterium]
MPSTADRPVLRVLTLNIWNRQGPWEARLALIRRGVEALAPHVVGLQEVMTFGDRSLAGDIAAGLGYESAFGEAHALGGGVSFGNGVLSRFPIRDTATIALPDAGAGERRSLLCTTLATPWGELPFLSTHLNWKFHHGYAREAQVLAIAEAIATRYPVRSELLPPVLTGDFNAVPESTEMRFLTGLHAVRGRSFYLADCFAEVGEGKGHTFDADRNPYAGLTWEAPRRIDYVLVRGPDAEGRGKPRSCRVVLTEVEDGVAASDHYGVFAEISL